MSAALESGKWKPHTPIDTSQPGPVEIAVRARSRDGSRQPDKLTVNPGGYHDNIVQTLTLEIA